MENQGIDEDSIDLAALQAQIDMSMSIAQEMISTWVKPSRQSRKLPNRSSIDIETELKEYMRRPPRLGVGAIIPEGHNTSREIARLKGQLVGKGNKRSRDDGSDAKEKSEDEQESRAGAIKKKARVDPFGDNEKKKRTKKSAHPELVAPPKTPVILETEAEAEGQEEVINMVIEDTGEPSTPFTTPQPKRKKKHAVNEASTESAVATELTSTPISSVQGVEFSSGGLHTPANNTAREPIDVSLTSTPATPLHIRRQAQSVALLKTPLLNLAPPQNDEASQDDEAKAGAPAGDSPKKKKRRRRKKKNGGNGSTAEAATEVADVL